ncbi:DUF4434 domain-containing protein [Kitasatospora sp. NPDC001664]
MIRRIVCFLAVLTFVMYGASVSGAQQTVPRAKFGATFYQPHTSGSDGWDTARWNLELSQIAAAGIGTVIVQSTVDDGGVASYPAKALPKGADVTTPLLGAASANGVKVWLGLAGPGYWGFYQNAADPAYTAQLLARQKSVAAELTSRYPGRIAGWYVPQEVDDALLLDPAKVAGARAYYTDLVAYLQSTTGLRVMASPFYLGGRLDPGQFAWRLGALFNPTRINVLAVQDGGGNGYGADQIGRYFHALRYVLRPALWTNADMYDMALGGGPMQPAKLQANLTAVQPYVSGYTGYSFTTQLGPWDLGTFAYYDAYRAYAQGTAP